MDNNYLVNIRVVIKFTFIFTNLTLPPDSALGRDTSKWDDMCKAAEWLVDADDSKWKGLLCGGLSWWNRRLHRCSTSCVRMEFMWFKKVSEKMIINFLQVTYLCNIPENLHTLLLCLIISNYKRNNYYTTLKGRRKEKKTKRKTEKKEVNNH